MNAWIVRVGLALTIGGIGLCLAGQAEIQPVRLALDLIDGSHIIGTPRIESVPVQTSYARMNVPLKQIMTMKIGEDRETASLDLQNGDKLKGVINLGPVKLETVFGKVSIGVEHIRELRVVLAGRARALPETLKRGLVLHYSFDQDDGNIVTDKSGKEHDGKVNGAKWTAKRGGALEFDGDEDYIDAGTTPDWDFDAAKNWTFAFWVYPRGSLASMCFFGRPGGDDTLNGGENYLYNQTSSSPHGISWGPVNGEWDTGATLLVDQWQQVVVMHNASTRRASICVNGVEKASVSVNSVGSSSGPLRIGDNANINFFKGMIDEVMIFHRVLSEEQVKRLYDAQK